MPRAGGAFSFSFYQGLLTSSGFYYYAKPYVHSRPNTPFSTLQF